MSQLRFFVREIVFHLYHFFIVKVPRIYARQVAERSLSDSAPPMVRLIDLGGVSFGVWIEYRGAIEDAVIGKGEWSADLLQYSEHFLPVAPVIIEIGANIGFESLYYAKRFPAGQIIAFEPGSYGYLSLAKSRTYNRLGNLVVHRLGVGNIRSQLNLRTPTAASGNKGLGSFQSNPDIDSTYTSEVVDVVTLDEFCANLDQLDLIKIDTQGFEWPILQGGLGLISRLRPTVIFEFEDHYHADATSARKMIADYFSALEYTLFTAHRDRLRPFDLAGTTHVHCDIFAMPNPKFS